MPTAAESAGIDSQVAPLSDAPSQNKLRVLVVDDNVDAAETLAALFSIYGHETRVADSGPAALEILGGFEPALAFLDIGMPGMNGYEVAKRIRADGSLRQMTLVALTGWGAEADRVKAQEAGFDLHFTKPVEMVKLDSILQLIASRQGKN